MGAATAAGEPLMARDPVLMLRTRQSGYAAAFDRVLEHLEQGAGPGVALGAHRHRATGERRAVQRLQLSVE
ncbi:MAG: hypothetical protein U0164_19810 [Gemmatimonadaceae bacterium]